MKKIITTFLLIFIFANLFAQVGRDFWFAPPEVLKEHDGPNDKRGDNPIILKIEITSGGSATINVTQPATGHVLVNNRLVNNGDTIHLAPAYTLTLDPAPILQKIEPNPNGGVGNNGLHISTGNTDARITYQVAAPNNGESFVLKAENALGEKFFTPFQTSSPNANINQRAAIDIVATEDGTEVTIERNGIVIVKSPLLLKGQTYSYVGVDNSIGSHEALNGLSIKSTPGKPVAVTVKDDAVFIPGIAGSSPPIYSSKDLLGDQVFPVDHLGKEYIAIKGGLDNTRAFEKMVLVATVPNTVIKKDGNIIANLVNAGDSYTDFYTSTSVYTSSETFYAFQVTGVGTEYAGQILNSALCSGTNQITLFEKLTRLTIITPEGTEGSFIYDTPNLFNKGFIVDNRVNPQSPLPASAWASVIIDGVSFKTVSLTDLNFQSSINYPVKIRSTNPNVKFQAALLKTNTNSSYFTSFTGNTSSIAVLPITIDPICPGGSVKFKLPFASGKEGVRNYSYQIDNLNNTYKDLPADALSYNAIEDSLTANPITTTTYKLRVTDTRGCRDTVSVKVMVNTGSSGGISLTGSTTACSGDSIKLNATSPNTGSYAWFINNVLASDVSGSEFGKVLNDGDSIKVIFSPSATCTSPDSSKVKVTVNPNPVASPVSNAPICLGDSVILDAKPTNGTPNATAPFYSYLWTASTGTIKDANAEVTKAKPTGETKYIVKVKDSKGCWDTTSVMVELLSTATSSLKINGPGPICSGEPMEFSAIPTNGGPSPSYAWYVNNVRINGETSPKYNPTGLNDGDKVRVELNSSLSCVNNSPVSSDVLTLSISQSTTPTVSIDDPGAKCNGETVTFIATHNDGGSTPDFVWIVNNEVVNGEKGQSFGPVLLSNGDVVKVILTSSMECSSPVSSDPIQVQYELVNVQVVPEYEIKIGESVVLEASSNGNYIYSWSPVLNLNDSKILNPIATPENTTTYKLIATSSIGCKDSANVTVTVKLPIRIPNAFSPNGDGRNDFWEIDGIETYPNAEVKVFNRWGNIIFESIGYGGSKQWEGTINGIKVPTGTYYYIVDIDEEGIKPFTNTLTIVK